MSKSKATRQKNPSAARAAKSAKRIPGKTGHNKPVTANAPLSVRGNSKLAILITLLRRKEGATIEQMMKATGWRPHSVRGALSGALKKKRGLTITSGAGRNSSRVYRIGG